MKIAMIHGQNHRGSTYHIGAMLAEKLGGEVTEFFLPRDFGEFCVGCNSCFMKAKEKCPHYEKLIPINKASRCHYPYKSGVCISCDGADESVA